MEKKSIKLEMQRLIYKMRKRLIFSIVISFLAATPLKATTYYFSTSGEDSNVGTDSSHPKKSLTEASNLALIGNTLLFKRGDTWYNPFQSFDLRGKSGTKENPIIIDAYGTGAKPIIATLDLLEDAGWTNIGGTNTWEHSVDGYSDAFRLFINGTSKYKVNTSNGSNTELAVDMPYEWYIKGLIAKQKGMVYVNTGSLGTPPKNVEVHPVGSVTTLIMQNSHYITIRNMDFRGGSQSNVIYIESPSSDLTIDNCIVKEANGSGILVTNLTSNTANFVSRVNITNNFVDKVWTSYENDPNILLSGDGIFILHAVDSALIKGNVVRNWGHVGITLSSYAYGYSGVHNIIVEQNDVSNGASGYMHALDVNGFDGYTTNNIIRRNYFHDYTSTVHLQGNDNQCYSNIFAGVRLTSQPKHSQQPWGLDLIPWKYTDGHWMAAHDNYIVNNTIVDCDSYPFVMSDNSSSSSSVDNNIIANNIMYKYGSAIGLNITPEVRGLIWVQNNDIWNFDASSAVARYKNNPPYYTSSKMNEANPIYCNGNIQVDPFFSNFADRDLRLTKNSADELRKGGTNKYETILGHEFTDYFGRPWDSEHPSMGAIQYSEDKDSIYFFGETLFENEPVGTTVGKLSYISSDLTPIVSYTLVSGAGDTDNALFSIDYDEIRTATLLDYEQKSSYIIRVRLTNKNGFWFEEPIIISLQNLDDSPTAVEKKNENGARLMVFPNPFNEETRIRFVLPATAWTILELADYKGHIVKRLYKGEAVRQQEYNFNLNSNSLSAGLYFIRLSTPNAIEIEKVILTK